MLQVFLSYLVLYGLHSNLMLNGAGTVVFQREKQYMSFRLLSTLFLVVGIALTATITFFLYKFVYSSYNLFYISASINVLIVGLYNILVSYIWKRFGKSFSYYLYDNAFSYAFDMVFTLSVIFTLNMSVSIAEFFVSLSAVVIVVFVTSIIIGFFVRNLNRGYMNVSFRNIPARLFVLAIFSIILYYCAQLVV